MSIFNIFGAKKNPALGILDHPEFKNAELSMGLEFLQKEILNLMAVGRKDDVLTVYTAFIKNFEKTTKGKASPADLSRICANVAHKILPDLFLRRHADYINYSNSPIPLNLYLLLKASGETGKNVSLGQANDAIKCSMHQLNADVSYCLVEYPAPPPQAGEKPLELIQAMLAAGKKPTLDMLPLQGPYFSFCGVNKRSGDLLCYMLQQSLSGSGTSMRQDTVKSSAGLAEAPPPNKDAFLAVIKARHSL